MHFMPDTEDKDSAAESFWPEGYKKVIREDMRQFIGAKIGNGKKFRHIFQRSFSEKYTDLDQFTNKIADMVAIGAENGADNTFDDIVSAFLTEAPLPEERRNARYFWPQAFSPPIKERFRQVIIDEYSQDNVYNHAYNVGYQDSYRDFDEFIGRVAQLVITGSANGADNMLEAIYRSFMIYSPLPPARRYPRRLKLWAPV